MKKVALELQPCLGHRSGIGMYAYKIASHIKNDNRLEFCGNLFNFRRQCSLDEELQGVALPMQEYTLIPYGVYRRIWHIIPLFYRMFFPRADLNIFFNFIVPPRVQGKVITTVHDLTYLRFPETMDRKNLKRIQKDIAYSIERSDRILTVSEFTKNELCNLLHVAEDKVDVVYNAPALSNEIVDVETFLKHHEICKPYILYVGTIEPRKNLVRLIQAYEKLKKETGIPHQLVLAGGKGWNSEEIYSTIKKSPDILPIGYVSDAGKNTLYQAAELFVFPSLYEGFGIPPLEAMTFGCPVVSSNAASLPEVVGDAAELVDPMNVESIAEGMWKVLSDNLCRAELVHKGYQQAKKFNWDDSAKKLMQICREVLEET